MTPTQPPKIFIVEDNLIYQQLIAKELQSISSDIHFFTEGESCIKALSLNPAIVVLDFNLAGDMNGLDTLQTIRSFNPSIYAVLFSSQKGLNTAKNFSRYGRFDFIEKKPGTFSRLREKISSSNIAC